MDRILRETRDFTERMPKQERKAYGQFFTGADAASFMAGLFDIDPSRPVLRILDAGAGSGILRSALTERIRHSGYAGRIELACYESDPAVLPLLRRAMDALADECGASCSIRAENYLTSQDFGNGDGDGVFDLVIGNPPYRKLNKASAEARARNQFVTKVFSEKASWAQVSGRARSWRERRLFMDGRVPVRARRASSCRSAA